MKILSAEFVTSAASPKQFPADGKPQVAFAGRSNVGKSSLINALLNRSSLVKTSATPGKTQLINFFLINGDFYCVDLPGYGYAKAPKDVVDAWAPMIEAYLRDSPQIRTVVVLLDIRRGLDDRDRRLMKWLRHYGIASLIVLTKADKVKRGEMTKVRHLVAQQLGLAGPPLLASVKSRMGIGELRTEIARRLKAPADDPGPKNGS
jgi:GTP-binding protein